MCRWEPGAQFLSQVQNCLSLLCAAVASGWDIPRTPALGKEGGDSLMAAVMLCLV